MNKHWILLRGLGRDKRHWGEFVSQFQNTFPNDQVSIIDTCGNGEYSQVKSPFSIAQYTDHCRQQLSVETAEVHIVALSLGGMIALDWAQRFPKEVVFITLINTSAANLTHWTRRINLSALGQLIIALFRKKSFESIENSILQLTSNLPITPKTLADWTRYRRASSTSLINLIRQLIAAARFKAEKLPNHSPVVLASKTDQIVNCVASEDIHRHLGGELILHPYAGHDLPLDDANWVIAQIKRHIDMSSSCH